MRPGSLPIAISAVFAALALAQSQSPIQLEVEKTFDRSLAAGGNCSRSISRPIRLSS